ncbi:MAG: GPR endopeptidase [Clostridia bacterium]|nr:GPR endopeptidase [Clostridia bacterium]
MMEKKLFRTDLAYEATDVEGQGTLGGVRRESRTQDGVEIFEVEITTQEASRRLHKSCGRYLTLSVGRVWSDPTEVFRRKVHLLSRELSHFLPRARGGVLLVGLGNRRITADAIGPMAMEHVLVTRHLEEKQPALFSSLELSRTAAIAPGVLGQTGIESADIIRSLVADLRPSMVLCVDALASRSLSRLATTVQISDAGIAPGSGVGNRRDALCEQTLGVPVCALGVPMVVDAASLAWDVLQSTLGEQAPCDGFEELLPEGLNFFVTPKETDEIMRSLSALIGYGINLALHPTLDYDEMLSLVG